MRLPPLPSLPLLVVIGLAMGFLLIFVVAHFLWIAAALILVLGVFEFLRRRR